MLRICSIPRCLVAEKMEEIDTFSAIDKDGETIVSAGGSFQLGFFSPGNSTRRYLGIWYQKISPGTVVWVANREIPLFDSSGVLKVTNQGILVLNRNDSIIWSSNSSRLPLNPVAKLLDSGNLVMLEENDDINPENFLWQSFDYPGNTFLSGMKLGRNTATGLEWYVSSWKSTDDPSRGDFTALIDPKGFPQLVIRKGLVVQDRAGSWNGVRFSGTPNLTPNSIYKYRFVFNQREMFYTYENVNSSVVTRVVLNPNGIMQRFIWIDRTQGWNPLRTAQTEFCSGYALCGVYGSCNTGYTPECGCLKGFVPKFPKQWDISDYSNGCVRRTLLNCQSGDGFIKYFGVKLPDTRYSWFNESMSLEECKMVCLNNCSCMAYANLDISAGGSGCLLWFGDLIDMRKLTENGQDMYIRMASSEVGQAGSNGKKRVMIIISSVLLAGMLLLGLGLTLYIWKKKKLGKTGHGPKGGYPTEELELPLFDFATIANATNNFSINNKLGEGGFGPVYKGVLKEGQDIAVKRLSKNSKQGLDEFMNEVSCIAKLQHRNLVKLVGCCIQEEKMLIYEYMPNKSLDFFIFGLAYSKPLIYLP